MSISLVLASLRRALPALPLEWVIWSLDADGMLLVHEGRGGPETWGGVRAGLSVWEAYRGETAILTFASRVLREPLAAELVAGGVRVHLSGAPLPGGGAVGMALMLGPASSEEAAASSLPPSVLELTRPVPDIGADAGDLLLWSLERPAVVALYREIAASRLPPAVTSELRLTRSSAASGSAPPAPASAGADRPLKERASHLRVVS